MRTLKIEYGSDKQTYVFITDWNFRKWVLTRNLDGNYDCGDIRGYSFASVNDFLVKMFGYSDIQDGNGKTVFLNYNIKKE